MDRHRSRLGLGALAVLLLAGCANAAEPGTSDTTAPTSDVAPDGPAPVREPDGDQYQAFVVPAPEGDSCTPFADQRAQGQPGLHNVEYEVVIPGVQPITQDWWGAQPIAIIEDDLNAWYRDHDTWLLADQVSAGNPSPGVAWVQGARADEQADGWRLVSNGQTPPPPGADECDYVLPIPEISGATWLIIEGADWATVEAENPTVAWETTDVMTWVYLGEAE